MSGNTNLRVEVTEINTDDTLAKERQRVNTLGHSTSTTTHGHGAVILWVLMDNVGSSFESNTCCFVVMVVSV